MTQPSKPPADRADPKLQGLARIALEHAVAARYPKAAAALITLAAEYPNGGAAQAALLWIDRWIEDGGAGPTRRTGSAGPVRLLFTAPGGASRTADQVTPETAWVGRLITARLADDEAMFAALMSAFNDDTTFGHHMSHLLLTIAGYYRTRIRPGGLNGGQPGPSPTPLGDPPK